MKKIIRIFFLLFFVGIVIASFFTGRITPNEEGAIGNTAGNLLNGGRFCEYDGKIYFANPKDRNALYVMDSDMTNMKKLSDDDASYINATTNYLVYVRDNSKRESASGQFFNFNKNGIYRINRKNGGGTEQLYGKPAGVTALKGNTIYYQHYNAKEGLHFYRVNLDKSEDTLISEEHLTPASFSSNTLIYHGEIQEHDIHAMDLDTYSSSIIYNGNCYRVVATSEYIYFLSLSNNYAIARVDLDGSNPTIIVKERCSFYNISPDEKYLYYQVDGGDHNRLCRMNLSTFESDTLADGDFNSIHVTTHYVFFKDFHTQEYYSLTCATGNISMFAPDIAD